VIVAEGLAPRVAAAIGRPFGEPIAKMKGEQLEHIRFRHPLYARPSVGVLGTYVTLDAGTGAVHTAPGHGADDFNTGVKYGLDIYAPVGAAGHFVETVELFGGQRVFDANPHIADALKERGRLWHRETFSHQYPHCWRCHNPVIFLATSQWFISLDGVRLKPDTTNDDGSGGAPRRADDSSSVHFQMDQDGGSMRLQPDPGDEGRTLREAALHAIDHIVNWVPRWGHDRIYNMVAGRPDWCISRQRVWGVPIPAVDCAKCGEAIVTPALVAKAAGVFERYGADSWYERPIEDFIPEGMVCPTCGDTSFEREMNILDVWFDSGSSHEAVLSVRPELTWPADIYLEGTDQHRGWFQSSLLVGLGTRGRPPYREVVTNGFVVDEDGRKMSKSLGNSLEPEDVIKASGADIIRLWVAMSDYTQEVRLGKEILARVSEAYRKIRNTMRYLIANLYDFDPAADLVAPSRMEEVDRYILARYAEVGLRILRAYREYDYSPIFHAVNSFTTVDLSAFFNDVSKDRLYTFAARSHERRSAQSAMYLMADGLTRLMAPILSFTSDELWQFLPGRREESVHIAVFPKAAELEPLVDRDLLDRWSKLTAVREQVLAAIEPLRKDKRIGSSLQAKVVLSCTEAELAFFERYARELPMLFIVSEVELRAAPGDVGAHAEAVPKVTIERASGVKCERCWRYVPAVSSDPAWAGICDRCQEALAETVNG
jgi:isoleucyl-tRNA synthetase